MLKTLLYAATLSVCANANGLWSYDRCLPNGPSFWPDQCGLKEPLGQTPIDLCGAAPFPAGPPPLTATGYNQNRTLQIFNNGHTIQVNVVGNDPPVLTAGNLSSIVGRAEPTSEVTPWKLAQVHFHWGRQGRIDEGSEHFMEGKKYPFEAHFVHYNGNYGGLGQALAGAGSKALLVVGFMFEIDDDDEAPFVAAVGAEATTARMTPVDLQTKVNLNDVFKGFTTGDFYSYAGGLTTPPCIQVVTWIVMTKPLKLSFPTLSQFKAAMRAPAPRTAAGKFAVQNSGLDPISLLGNFRPLQPRGGRTVYHSKGYYQNCTVAPEQYDSVFPCVPTWTGRSTGARTFFRKKRAIFQPNRNAGSSTLPALWLQSLVAAAAVALLWV